MNKLYLALVLHNHQPIGNFDFVVEDAYQKAYEPMIAALERHPGVRLAVHYSGALRDWLKIHHPDFLRRVRALVGRKQLEILTGAHFEPILVSLPDADKLGQIAKLTESIRADFGAEPIGVWLAERVWEPHLPKVLHEAGLEYTIVDDTHFKVAGYGDDDLFGYYVTEEQGQPLKIHRARVQAEPDGSQRGVVVGRGAGLAAEDELRPALRQPIASGSRQGSTRSMIWM